MTRSDKGSGCLPVGRVLGARELGAVMGGGAEPAQTQVLNMEGDDKSTPPPMIPVPPSHKLPLGMESGSGMPEKG